MAETSGSSFEEMPDAHPRVLTFLPTFIVGLILPRAVGMLIALWVYRWGDTDLFERNIRGLADAGQFHVYVASVMFGCLTSWLNAYPMVHKNRIMRSSSDHLRATTAILRESGLALAPYVLLESAGQVGCYNRANRSLFQFCESSVCVVLTILLAGFAFPFPAFVATATFALGRIVHQIGLASVGYGGHVFGFMLCLLSSMTLEMLCLLVALKAFGTFPCPWAQ